MAASNEKDVFVPHHRTGTASSVCIATGTKMLRDEALLVQAVQSFVFLKAVLRRAG